MMAARFRAEARATPAKRTDKPAVFSIMHWSKTAILSQQAGWLVETDFTAKLHRLGRGHRCWFCQFHR
jgi:hypothetical protein